MKMFKHIIEYDLSVVDIDELQAMYEFLEEEHGKGNFLFIPKEFTYREFTISEMKEIRNRMNAIIKEAEREEKNKDRDKR